MCLQTRSHDQLEKFKRTAVIGGFQLDSMKNDVEAKIKDIVQHWGGVDEAYAYRRCSIGFVRFMTVDAMCAFVKGFNAKDAVKPTHGERQLWAAPSRSPEDCNNSRQFSMYKTVLTEAGLASADNVDYDVRRGALWVGRERVAEWEGDDVSGQLVLKQDKLKRAGIDVETKMLVDAVAEKISSRSSQ